MKRCSIFPLIAAVLTVAFPQWISAQERPYPWGWEMHPMWMMGGFWGIGMMLMMLLFWLLVIAAIVLGIRWLLSQSRGPRSDSALEILRERYARGEINKEEFEARKRDLGA
jgi:putative membrane protein